MTLSICHTLCTINDNWKSEDSNISIIFDCMENPLEAIHNASSDKKCNENVEIANLIQKLKPEVSQQSLKNTEMYFCDAKRVRRTNKKGFFCDEDNILRSNIMQISGKKFQNEFCNKVPVDGNLNKVGINNGMPDDGNENNKYSWITNMAEYSIQNS